MKKENFSSRFGYIMVAAGAAIGLGNIWKFPYLAYGGGGGTFIFVYVILCVLLGIPVVEMESAIGRFGKANAIAAYGKINRHWKFVGVIHILCTILIDVFYIVVSGYVLKYAITYLISGDFGTDKTAYYDSFISNPIEPVLYTGLLMLFVSIMLSFGITKFVTKLSKIIMPALFVLLFICGMWAMFSSPEALTGLQFYLIPDFSSFTLKNFADACVQVMFSVGGGWAIYITLGASLSDEANIRKDSRWITICDTAVALLAGFVIIPSVVGAGTTMEAGPSLVFIAMTDIFDTIPGGRAIGFFFFAALVLAVISSYFTFLEIPVKCVEEKFNIPHWTATMGTAAVIFIGSVICSLGQGTGLLSNFKLPWWSFSEGVLFYSIYDWLDCFTGYVLLPLGNLLIAVFCTRIWKFSEFGTELTKNGRDGKITLYDKIVMTFVVPLLTIIVILNCFGFIK